MKKIILIIILFIMFGGNIIFAQRPQKEKYAIEFSLGPRIPLGITKDDITTGLSFRAGVGYKLTKNFELFHLSIDFGNSSPHNPDILFIQDYYDYYGRAVMETVNIYGFPLTTRYHLQLQENIEGFIGAGGAYYWYSSKLQDVYYGDLRKPRKRHGFGSIFESGLITNFFSERWLIMLKGDLVLLKTTGKSLSLKRSVNPEATVERDDKYLSIVIGVRYYFH